jgi:hypothetical protein
MPFGRHKGTRVCDLTDSYLLYLSALEDLRDPVLTAVRVEYHRRFQLTAQGQGLLWGVKDLADTMIERGREALLSEVGDDSEMYEARRIKDTAVKLMAMVAMSDQAGPRTP